MLIFLGLGQGWNISKIGDNVEYQFINLGHRSDYYKFNFYIGGTTSVSVRDTILTQNFGFTDGIILVQF